MRLLGFSEVKKVIKGQCQSFSKEAPDKVNCSIAFRDWKPRLYIPTNIVGKVANQTTTIILWMSEPSLTCVKPLVRLSDE